MFTTKILNWIRNRRVVSHPILEDEEISSAVAAAFPAQSMPEGLAARIARGVATEAAPLEDVFAAAYPAKPMPAPLRARVVAGMVAASPNRIARPIYRRLSYQAAAAMAVCVIGITFVTHWANTPHTVAGAGTTHPVSVQPPVAQHPTSADSHPKPPQPTSTTAGHLTDPQPVHVLLMAPLRRPHQRSIL